jgi:hypothetical protein
MKSSSALRRSSRGKNNADFFAPSCERAATEKKPRPISSHSRDADKQRLRNALRKFPARRVVFFSRAVRAKMKNFRCAQEKIR